MNGSSGANVATCINAIYRSISSGVTVPTEGTNRLIVAVPETRSVAVQSRVAQNAIVVLENTERSVKSDEDSPGILSC